MKHLLSILLLSTTFAILIGSSNTFASTEVSGEITVDTVWTLTGSPYLVTGTIYIMSGVDLIVEKDVIVEFQSNIYIRDEASLIADGVTFRNKQGYSYHIQFSSSSGLSSIKNCTLNGVSLYLYPGAAPSLSGITFENTSHPGIMLAGRPTSAWTLPKYDWPYFLTDYLYIRDEASLIADGVTFRNKQGYSYHIQFSSSSGLSSIKNCTLNGVSLYLYPGAAPSLSGITFENTSHPGIMLAGRPTSAWTLPKYDWPYFLTDYLYIRDEASLIADGVTFRNKQGYSYHIQFSSSSGLSSIKNCTLDGVSLYLYPGAAPSLSGITFENTSHPGIMLAGRPTSAWTLPKYDWPYFLTDYLYIRDEASMIADGVTFRNKQGYSYHIQFSSSSGLSSIKNCTLNGVSLYLYPGAAPSLSGITFENTSHPGIMLAGRPTSAWTLPKYDWPYFLTDYLYIRDEASMIADGVTFRNKQGYSYHIQFSSSSGLSSIKNCTLDGVSLYLYPGAAPSLSGITFENTSHPGIMLAGRPTSAWTLPKYDWPYFLTDYLYIRDEASMIADGVTFRNKQGYSYHIQFSSSSGLSSIKNCTLNGVSLYLYPGAAPSLSGITFENTSHPGIMLAGRPTSAWTLPKYDWPYFLTNYLYIRDEASLIADGVTFRNKQGYSYHIQFSSSSGLSSIKNCTLNGVSLYLYPGAAPSLSGITFENTSHPGIMLAGRPTSAWTLPKYDWPYFLTNYLYIRDEASLIADGVTFRNKQGYSYHIQFSSSSGLSSIKNCTLNGVSIQINSSTPTIRNCFITNTDTGILCKNDAKPTITNNNIVGNIYYGLKNEGTNIIIAENNWWGDASGPRHSSNSDGAGDKVSDNVDFRPWATQPNTIETTKPTLKEISIKDHFSVPTKTLQMLYDTMLFTFHDILAQGSHINSTVSLEFSNPESISQVKGIVIPAYIINTSLIYEIPFIKKDDSTYMKNIKLLPPSDTETSAEETFFNIASETFSNSYHIAGIPAYKQNPVFPTMRLKEINVTLSNGEILTFPISLEEGELPSFSDRLWNMTYFYDNKITIAGFSPIDILVIDSEGNKLGTEYINGEAKTYFEIPNSIYSGDTEPEFVILSDVRDLDYKIIVQGTDTGTFNQTIKKYEKEETQVYITEVVYEDVPVDNNTRATLTISIPSEDYGIEIDENNDKIIDKIKEPDSIETETVTSVEEIAESLPTNIILHQNYPNPFNPKTIIKYQIPTDCYVELVIYDILGRKISVLQEGKVSTGVHEVIWGGKNEDGTAVGSGVYIYLLKADKYIRHGKMLLIR